MNSDFIALSLFMKGRLRNLDIVGQEKLTRLSIAGLSRDDLYTVHTVLVEAA